MALTSIGKYYLLLPAFCYPDSGKILKVVFGTTDNGINFPIIAEKIEVRSKAWLLYVSLM